MNEMTIRLERNGAAAVPGGQLLLGYAGNRGNYRLRIEQRGEWKGLTVCAHWHTPGASAATLVESGFLAVPAAVTAVPGVGCITFEGTDGSRTVTSADVRCKVCANSGTAEGTMPAPATPAWEALVGLLGTGGITTAEKQALLAILRLLATGNDAAMAAYRPYCLPAAGSGQSGVERSGQARAAHRERHRGTAGDGGYYHCHRPDRVVEE